MTDDDSDATLAKTLWSETVIDLLRIALEREKSDDQVKELARECMQKGFKKDYLVQKITKELGNKAAFRLRQLI
jgi:hypothetical protein